jgi:NAD(P)-dependent dehydrogenase (short-subunit alcohol dehydrogenase family)
MSCMSTPPSTGRTAVITGGAQGIGRAYAKRLAQDGHNVVVADIQPADATIELVSEVGGTGAAIECDVTSEDSVKALHDEVAGRFGGADILVNNAIAYAMDALEDLSLADWRRVQSVAVDGSFLMARAFVPDMRAKGWGRIVNIASNTLDMSLMFPGLLPYITAKGGVVGFTRALASEVGADGITVNAVAPGLTKTEITAEVMGSTGLFERMVEAQSIPRTELPEDLVGTVSFLASDDSGFITGQTIIVDGGLVRR